MLYQKVINFRLVYILYYYQNQFEKFRYYYIIIYSKTLYLIHKNLEMYLSQYLILTQVKKKFSLTKYDIHRNFAQF